MAADNRLLGAVQPRRHSAGAARHAARSRSKFNIDANGILNVVARDLGTGKEQTITIEKSGGLSKDEIEKMRRDAEAHADEDKRRRELAEARNQADSMVYQLEKLMKENKDKLSDPDQEAVKAAIANVMEAKKGEDAAAINRCMSTTFSVPARPWPSTCTQPRPSRGAVAGQSPGLRGPLAQRWRPGWQT